MKTANVGAVVGVLLLAGAMFLTGRASVPAPPPCPTETNVTHVKDGRDVISDDLMVALDQAKNFHRKAKVYMSDGNLAAATSTVREILSLPFPKGAPEADDVRLDARALLAKLLVMQGQIDEATRTVDEGLAAVQRESFFVANLYTVRGEILEAKATNIDAENAGDKTKSADVRRAAIEAYDKSIQINEKLQKQLVEHK
ncbi:MAG TPA: hypothetical protein VGM90_36205 [Kofleriaceae bacterium]|jgi:predicted negative regulator of RcsB-dependent stress response